MDWGRFRGGLVGGVAVVALLAGGVLLIERHEADRSFDRQIDAVHDELGLAASRLTRDLIQQVALVQGLVALASSNEAIDQEAFAAYTRNFRRDHENLRRVFLVRGGRVTHTDRPAASAGSFGRIENALAPTQPMAAAAVQKGSVVMAGPVKTTEGDSVFIYARPIFTGDGRGTPAQFWGFAGINIDEDSITCALGLCEKQSKYRMAVRFIIDGASQPPFTGEAALFEPEARAVRVSANIPGVQIEAAAIPALGWAEGAPRRWMIRGIGGALALFIGGLVLILVSRRPGQAMRTRLWAAVGSAGVLLLVLGLAAVLDRFEGERVSHETHDATTRTLQRAAARATSALSDDVAVIENLTTFVQADANPSDGAFQRYAQRIRELHPNIVSLQLAPGTVTRYNSPPEPDRLGLDLRRSPAETAWIERSIVSGEPILSGPMRVGSYGETFLYRKPIYLGDATPSRERFWGFATIRLARDAVVCPLGACDQPPKYRYALRLVVNQAPEAPFAGDAVLFASGSDAARAAVRIPGGRVEIAAVPIVGWSEAGGLRWLIWIVAIPLALVASGRLLFVFFGLPMPVLRVWVGLLVVLGGCVLALLQDDVAQALHAAGLQHDTAVMPAIATLIAFATAYTINATLSAFVWPQQAVGQVDALQRAPAILRHFIAILLYGTAALWAVAFAFNLDLSGVGLTSGAVGIIVGFATQRLILDFFSGVMLGIERPFALGDWIELNTGSQDVRGVVSEMTWRTTMVRNVNLDIVTIPNSILAQATVINRSRPQRYTQIVVSFAIAAAEPLARVEKVAQNALVPLLGNVLTAQPKPNLRVASIHEGDLNYRLNVYAALGPNSEEPIRSKVAEALQTGFAEAGIAFSSTSATVLRILAGAHNAAKPPN